MPDHTLGGAVAPKSSQRPLAPADPTEFGGMVGTSAPMRALFILLRRAAASDATVLIEGETGTGKEASANAIHNESHRSAGPFVVVDCGAIPAQLLESELFGYERGAFTGAVGSRQGAFEAASGGTIFLDEIGELGLDLQPKILRAIERRQIKRIGSTNYVPADVRVIAATNRSLRAEVEQKRFRSDLYYRLAVIRVRLPPLRDRLADLPILLRDVLRKLGVADRPEADALRSPAFLDALGRYRWPGNVRQFRNYLERCVALGDAETPPGIDTEPPASDPRADLDADVGTPDISQPLRAAREDCVARFERKYLEAILEHYDDNVTMAARAAGVDRIHFYRLLWKYGLRAHDEKSKTGGS